MNERKNITLLFLIFFIQSFESQNFYEIDLDVPDKNIYSDHLQLGGTNDDGQSLSVNNFYISKNGQPIIPITGEFHFSRYPREYWDDAIKKMKAGGINMIATYVFWNMHEEFEGQFLWSGNRDVRTFVELCQQNNLPVIIRIGPFGHGEIRNGALPDWLFARPLTIRSNDPEYLTYVERLYNEIGKQLKGLFFKEGGPIIATQIENEYQASAAPWGLTYPGQPLDFTSSERDKKFTQDGVGISLEKNPYASLGNEHMKILKTLAQKAGITTPLYTATGWGNAAIIPGETLPVTAAYAYPTWTKKRDISPFYLYKDMHADPDYSPVRYNPEHYPAFAAELGGGIMSTYDRRPQVPAESLDALINRCLGSGANGIGYYMYHGGSTPKGETYFFNDEAYGYPKISYDFQAPIGEFGQTRPSFHRLKLLHEFINSYSNILAPMQTTLPANNSEIKPTDINDLRYAVRHKKGSGFIFLNNFQDDTVMTSKTDIKIRLKYKNKVTNVPENSGFDLQSDENAIFPFNFDLNGNHLNYATAQLLTGFKNGGVSYFVFFAPNGVQPEFSIKNSGGIKLVTGDDFKIEKNKSRWLVKGHMGSINEFEIISKSTKTKVLIIPKSLALKFWKIKQDQNTHVLFSDATVLEGENGFKFLSKGENSFELSVYPRLKKKPMIDLGEIYEKETEIEFSEFRVELPEMKLDFNSEMVSEKRLVVNFNGGIPDHLENAFLELDYIGDTAMGFFDGALVVDEFYKGLKWEIGLRELINLKGADKMNFYFRPIYKNASFLVDLMEKPDFSKSTNFVDLKSVEFIPEYKTNLTFN